MNKQQTQYALDRAKQIFDAKHAALRPAPPKRLMPREMLLAIKSGAFTINEYDEEHYYSERIRDYVTFHGEETKKDVFVEMKLEKLKKDYLRLRDTLVLGEAEQALQLLGDFESDK